MVEAMASQTCLCWCLAFIRYIMCILLMVESVVVLITVRFVTVCVCVCE